MQFKSATFANQLWPIAKFGPKGPYAPLTTANASHMSTHLAEDAAACYFTALIILADVARAVDQKFFSWSAIKLYYLSYTLVRARLCLDGIAMFHLGKYPRWCEARAGDFPHPPPKVQGQLGSETSHKLAFNLFTNHNSSDTLLSQDIEARRPFDWLQEKREHFNYRIARLSEPVAPSCLAAANKQGFRNVLTAYTNDKSFLYAFDPDHAIIAYPVELLKAAKNSFNNRGLSPLDDEGRTTVRSYWRDKFGPVNLISNWV